MFSLIFFFSLSLSCRYVARSGRPRTRRTQEIRSGVPYARTHVAFYAVFCVMPSFLIGPHTGRTPFCEGTARIGESCVTRSPCECARRIGAIHAPVAAFTYVTSFGSAQRLDFAFHTFLADICGFAGPPVKRDGRSTVTRQCEKVPLRETLARALLTVFNEVSTDLTRDEVILNISLVIVGRSGFTRSRFSLVNVFVCACVCMSMSMSMSMSNTGEVQSIHLICDISHCSFTKRNEVGRNNGSLNDIKG